MRLLLSLALLFVVATVSDACGRRGHRHCGGGSCQQATVIFVPVQQPPQKMSATPPQRPLPMQSGGCAGGRCRK